MQPGLYYIQEINKLLAVANREARASVKALPGILKPLYAQFDAEVSRLFPTHTREKSYRGKDRDLTLAPGVTVDIRADELDPKSPLGKIRTAVIAAEAADAAVCAVRCSLDSQKDVGEINRFKAYVRSVYGSDPSPEDIAKAFVDYRAPSEAHDCPIPKRRRA